MVMFAIYLFVYVKLNFLVFSSSFISSSCFTWWHLWNAATLITCLTCKLMRQVWEKAAKSQGKLKKKVLQFLLKIPTVYFAVWQHELVS